MSVWEPCVGASDEWFTPRYIFDALGMRFDLDVAAPVEGPRHAPAVRWYSSEALEREWEGFVWMNPPFGARNGLEPWLDKFIHHGNGVALVPDRTSAPWFQHAAKRVGSILFISPKVKFERPDGSVGKSPGTGTALLAMGVEGEQALRNGSSLGFLCRRAEKSLPF